MDVGFKLNMKTPKGISGRINHWKVSLWLRKHGLQMAYTHGECCWMVSKKTPVNKKQWKEFYKIA